MMEVFRRILLLRLHKAERLSERFMHNLLSWVHPGFSVYAGPPVDAAEIASMESQARYITRPVLAWMPCTDSTTAASFWRLLPIQERVQPPWSWIRSSGSTA